MSGRFLLWPLAIRELKYKRLMSTSAARFTREHDRWLRIRGVTWEAYDNSRSPRGKYLLETPAWKKGNERNLNSALIYLADMGTPNPLIPVEGARLQLGTSAGLPAEPTSSIRKLRAL